MDCKNQRKKSYKKTFENSKGIAFVNVVLFAFIALATIIIITLIVNDMSSNKKAETADNSINSNKVIISKNATTNTNETNNVKLNNNIINSNQTGIDEKNTIYSEYYYNQLDSNAKSMYSTIIKNIPSLKSGTDKIEFELSQSNIENSFQSAWDAICLDRPEIFYIDTKKLTLITQTNTSIFGNVKYKYMIQPQEGKNYFIDTWATAQDAQNSIDDVEKVANNIVSKASGSTYDKVKYIHDKIIDNVEYDQTNYINNSNIYGALIKNTAVCEGYAETFKYLADKLNLESVIVYGNGADEEGNSEFHAWNEVKMDDGKWYAIDTTWDDPIIIGGGKVSASSKYKDFLKGSKTFFKQHTNVSDVSGTGQNFKYPELSEDDFKK